MGYIIKATPDENWYCLWYTGPDAPGDFGTREFLSSKYNLAEDRWVRADATGTSVLEAALSGWDDPGWMVRELFPEARHLPRENLKAFCLAYQAENTDAMLALTKAYENE